MLKYGKPVLTLTPCSSSLIQPSALICFLTTTCYNSTLLRLTDLHFVYVCFPMRSHEGDRMWDQLQCAGPWSQSTEAMPQLLARAVFNVYSNRINIVRDVCPNCLCHQQHTCQVFSGHTSDRGRQTVRDPCFILRCLLMFTSSHVGTVKP